MREEFKDYVFSVTRSLCHAIGFLKKLYSLYIVEDDDDV
jgi:hypothetical protein